MHRLIFAPHIDDAEFGLGGSMTLWRDQGDTTHVVICAGETYMRGEKRVDIEERLAEATTAFRLLGAQWRFDPLFKENWGHCCNYAYGASRVQHHIDHYSPDEVYVPLPGFNQDHTAIYELYQIATRPNSMTPARRDYAYEYPGTTPAIPTPLHGLSYRRFGELHLTTKLAALSAHTTQFDGRPSGHIGLEGAKKLAALRGSECSAEYAELTYLIREVG